MFHLEYNRERGFFDWSELRCLCRALGFQPDLITMNLPKEVDQTEPGMMIKDILRIINLKYLDLVVDKTFNAHTADWNLCVFKKAFVLLDHRILSYQELHDIRVAFCAYEHQDLKGMEISENTIIRCLKMCGRIIAPLKMHHRIKHMSQLFDEEGRIQLYEFLDLILWTELHDTHRPHEPIVTNKRKEGSDSYEVEDFEHIIKHYDERLAEYLNELYLHEEWSFGKEEFSKQKLPDELPVNRDFRLKNMRRSNREYDHLKNHVDKSQQNVHITSTGHIRPRPLTAPNLEKYDQSEKSSIYTAHSQQNRLSVADMVRDYIQPPVSRIIRSASPRMKRSEGIPARIAGLSSRLAYDNVPSAVTSEESLQRTHELQNLKFHLTTLDNRYEQKLQREVQEEVPNYVPRPKVEEPPKIKVKTTDPALLPDHINRLAYAPYRPLPKPNHGQKCDARFRGWHKVKTSKGPHFVLTTTSFSNCPTAKLQEKLNDDSCRVVKTVKGDCVMRRTKTNNVKTEITRPSAPMPAIVSHFSGDNSLRDKADQPAQTPKTQSSSARLLLSGLDTIKERGGSRKHSAERSIGASSNKTYSFNDFKIYSEEYEKPEEKVEANARNLTDISSTAAPVIKIHGSKLPTYAANYPRKDRRYSQISGDDLAKEIVEQVDQQMDGIFYSQKHVAAQVKKMKNFAERRNLSGFVRKRLIDSAYKRAPAAVSAC